MITKSLTKSPICIVMILDFRFPFLSNRRACILEFSYVIIMLFVYHMHDLRIDQLLVKSFPRCGMIQPLKGRTWNSIKS